MNYLKHWAGGRPKSVKAPGGAGASLHTRSGAACLLQVSVFTEFFNGLCAERWQVIGLPARDQSLIGHDFPVNPGRAGVLNVLADRRVRRDRASLQNVRLHQQPKSRWPWMVLDALRQLVSVGEHCLVAPIVVAAVRARLYRIRGNLDVESLHVQFRGWRQKNTEATSPRMTPHAGEAAELRQSSRSAGTLPPFSANFCISAL
jgi:hypothetical protein